MFIEEQEFNDWNTSFVDANDTKKEKSISAYWLNNWYEKIKDITFDTVIYNSVDEIPDILPFKKCATRYENKSPKDSEFWGPISTKEELINLYYTSLRCKTNPGKYYCVREWIDLGDEYRCFWNNGLIAISSESEFEPPINQILNYINSIKSKIFYNRCVFDISHIKETNELIFIEFNSFESNSGAHRFDWIDDTHIFYSPEKITIKWLTGQKEIYDNLLKVNSTLEYIIFKMNNELYEFVKLNKPSNYLITEKYIYIANDIWLGRFDLNLNPINWTRGVFRFDQLQLCTNGSIYCNNKYYYYDLTPIRTNNKNKIDTNYFNDGENLNINLKYGILIKNKHTDEILFVRMLDNCDLVI